VVPVDDEAPSPGQLSFDTTGYVQMELQGLGPTEGD
jgi:hypothetical protein